MQFVTNFTRLKFQNDFLPKKRVNYDKLCFTTKQRKLYFHIVSTHTQGYITLKEYIVGIASRVAQTMALIGRPKTKRIPAHMDDPRSEPNLQRPG